MSKLDKRIEAVEQAIGKLATPAQEAEIKAYCQQHGLKYIAGEPVIVVSIPDAAPDDPLLSHEDGTQHYAALEAMGANVLHFKWFTPTISRLHSIASMARLTPTGRRIIGTKQQR